MWSLDQEVEERNMEIEARKQAENQLQKLSWVDIFLKNIVDSFRKL
ncbi:MAG: hypothetical protein HQM14_02835 [SAR324 cluster bacterium]|nr:hypothetical protein [SAR324 cluster bacterium]